MNVRVFTSLCAWAFLHGFEELCELLVCVLIFQCSKPGEVKGGKGGGREGGREGGKKNAFSSSTNPWQICLTNSFSILASRHMTLVWIWYK